MVNAGCYVHLFYLMGLIGNRVSKCVTIQIWLLVTQEYNVLQVLTLTEGIIANLSCSITHYDGLKVQTVVERIVRNLRCILGKNHGFQHVKFPEHVFRHFVVVLNIVILTVSVEANIIVVSADSCFIEVKIVHARKNNFVGIFFFTTTEHTQHSNILTIDATNDLQCLDGSEVTTDATYIVSIIHLYVEAEFFAQCTGNCHFYYLDVTLLLLADTLDMVSILGPRLAVSIFLAGCYINHEFLGKILKGISCQVGDFIANYIDSGQRSTATESIGRNGFQCA